MTEHQLSSQNKRKLNPADTQVKVMKTKKVRFSTPHGENTKKEKEAKYASERKLASVDNQKAVKKLQFSTPREAPCHSAMRGQVHCRQHEEKSLSEPVVHEEKSVSKAVEHHFFQQTQTHPS